MTDTKRLSLHGRLRMAAACPDPNAPLLAEAADAIEQHEAFRREVSDAAIKCFGASFTGHPLNRFIIAKPDPLHECLEEALARTGEDLTEHTERLRAAFAARGLEIVKKEPSQ